MRVLEIATENKTETKQKVTKKCKFMNVVLAGELPQPKYM